mgnify:CR=1 FL=1
MKKLLIIRQNVVKEALQGMQAAYEGTLDYTPGAEVISRHEKGDKVAVISGGGAGHELFTQALSEKVCWMQQFQEIVFSSPSPDRIGAAIEKMEAGKRRTSCNQKLLQAML